MPRPLPLEIEHLADAVERAKASLAAAKATAEQVRLTNGEALAAVERSRELLDTLSGLRDRFPYLASDPDGSSPGR